MKNWTKEEMEALYMEIQKRAATDLKFRKALLADANKAIEELIGEPLPDGCALKAVEQDPNYTATFVIPDFVGDELSPDMMDQVAAADGSEPQVGISFAAIVTVCGAAIDTVGCPGDVCGGVICVGDIGCVGQVCGADINTL